MRGMFIQVPMQTSYGSVRQCRGVAAVGTDLRRAPSLRFLVGLALKCESAEELSKKLKRRFDRQQQRRGIGTGHATAEAEAEIDRLLGQD
jgi:hypothetical protein